MKTPDYKLQAPLKTIDEVIDWLRTTKPRALCLIAEGDSPSQVHMVMFNADKAGTCCSTNCPSMQRSTG